MAVYKQNLVGITVDGVNISGLFSGTSVTYVRDGGEVQKTEGTDGAGINIATDQGATLRFTLRESSASHKFLDSVKRRQANGGDGVTIIVRSGANVLHAMNEAFLSNPGEKATGDKTEGGIEYTAICAEATDSHPE